MDRKSVIGFVLIAVILTVWMTINSNNNAKEAAVIKRQQDSIAKIDAAKKNQESIAKIDVPKNKIDTIVVDSLKVSSNQDSINTVLHNESLSVFIAASKGENKPIVIENEKIKATIFPLGGIIGQVELKGLKTSAGKPLILFTKDSTHFGLAFFDKQRRRFSTDSLYFSAVGKAFTVSGKDSNSIALRLYADSTSANNPQYIEYLYSLRGNTYMLGCTISFVGFDKVFPNDMSYVDLSWGMKTPTQEKSVTNERDVATVFYNFVGEEGLEELSTTENEKKSLTGELKWVSFKQQYFSSILIANTKFTNGSEVNISIPSDPLSVKSMSCKLPVLFRT